MGYDGREKLALFFSTRPNTPRVSENVRQTFETIVRDRLDVRAPLTVVGLRVRRHVGHDLSVVGRHVRRADDAVPALSVGARTG